MKAVWLGRLSDANVAQEAVRIGLEDRVDFSAAGITSAFLTLAFIQSVGQSVDLKLRGKKLIRVQ